ncbi:hypothetical protein BD309DRAFT_962814 [Dichomitus squalens]|nr:hypothetical protein BD309DRAFT_962814 [Dichomitus squalens]
MADASSKLVVPLRSTLAVALLARPIGLRLVPRSCPSRAHIPNQPSGLLAGSRTGWGLQQG